MKTDTSKAGPHTTAWANENIPIPTVLQYWLNELPANEKLKQTQIAITNLRRIKKHISSSPK